MSKRILVVEALMLYRAGRLTGGDLGTGSKRPSYRLYAKITAADATPCQALSEGIDLIIMTSGKSQ